MNPQIIIHVRFAPNGRVIQISECPPRLTPDQWFDVLKARADSAYRSRPRGRGVFRLTRAAVDTFKQQAVTLA
ncbi:hypothetical protein IVA98_09285 [Bradyrhizobium sp. 160]|uniref:hypothetical protein n=1 Tax=Bradyrhizobium sp. 160 TaxID=2782634 RepID=UPI001FF72943|nr:hypothetical protein [Bradyrhizobium sp. 160]MCK1623398.1 hypothetical protein [Bradyrhizobium sp. 160]